MSPVKIDVMIGIANITILFCAFLLIRVFSYQCQVYNNIEAKLFDI